MKTATILRNVRRDPDLRRAVNLFAAAGVFTVISILAVEIGAAAIRAAADHDMGLDQSMGKLPPYNPKAGVTPASQKAPDAPAVASGGWVPITLTPEVKFEIQKQVQREVRKLTRPQLPMVAPDPKVKVHR